MAQSISKGEANLILQIFPIAKYLEIFLENSLL